MTWKGYKLNVDLTSVPKTSASKNSKAMPSTRQSNNRSSRKRGTLLKALLVLVVIGLLTQAAHVYLSLSSMQSLLTALTQLSQPLQAIQPVPTASGDEPAKTERGKAVIYSYPGVETLPNGDFIATALWNHPDVFYLRRPYRLTNSTVSPGVTKNKLRFRRQRLAGLLSCDPGLLRKAQRETLQQTSAAVRRHLDLQRMLLSAESRVMNKCLTRSLTVMDVVHRRSEIGLRNVLLVNSTVKYVHVTADPRFVMINLWLQQRKKETSEEISLYEDLPVIQQIAQEYCSALISDIKTMKKLRSADCESGSPTRRYMVIRQEELIGQPLQTIQRLFDFLELPVTEEVREKIKQLKNIEIGSLYNDVHSHVKEIAEKKCRQPIKDLGYPTTAEINRQQAQLKPYNPWWK